MEMCICECEIGQSGAPCKHQYLIWLHVHKKGNAFLPFLTGEERKEYSFIAIGGYLPDSYYEGLHDMTYENIESSVRNKQVETGDSNMVPLKKTSASTVEGIIFYYLKR